MANKVCAEDWFKEQQKEILRCEEVIKQLQRQKKSSRDIVEIALKGIFLPVAQDFNKINDGVGFEFKDLNNRKKFVEYKDFLILMAMSLLKFLYEEAPNEDRINDFLDKQNDMIQILLTFDFSNIQDVQKAIIKRDSFKPNNKTGENKEVPKGTHLDEVA